MGDNSPPQQTLAVIQSAQATLSPRAVSAMEVGQPQMALRRGHLVRTTMAPPRRACGEKKGAERERRERKNGGGEHRARLRQPIIFPSRNTTHRVRALRSRSPPSPPAGVPFSTRRRSGRLRGRLGAIGSRREPVEKSEPTDPFGEGGSEHASGLSPGAASASLSAVPRRLAGAVPKTLPPVCTAMLIVSKPAVDGRTRSLSLRRSPPNGAGRELPSASVPHVGLTAIPVWRRPLRPLRSRPTPTPPPPPPPQAPTTAGSSRLAPPSSVNGIAVPLNAPAEAQLEGMKPGTSTSFSSVAILGAFLFALRGDRSPLPMTCLVL